MVSEVEAGSFSCAVKKKNELGVECNLQGGQWSAIYKVGNQDGEKLMEKLEWLFERTDNNNAVGKKNEKEIKGIEKNV